MNHQIVDTLRRAVRASHRSSTEIAAELGVNPVSVRKFSSGKLNFSLETLVKLAELEGYALSTTLRKIAKKSKISA